MTILEQYITFLREYQKLVEHGIKDILGPNAAGNFIWVNDINDLIDAEVATSSLPSILSTTFNTESPVLVVSKPVNHNIEIPEDYKDKIELDEHRLKFTAYAGYEEAIQSFQNSPDGKSALQKLKNYKNNKETYSKLYRAYNDIKNDSNLEIVLSIALIQYSKININTNLSKTNQHLFHFPLTLELDIENRIKVVFSQSESPYADFSFLNSTPVEKRILSDIIEKFEIKITQYGSSYLTENDFFELISKDLQQISDNSIFEHKIDRPEIDHYRVDNFKIAPSPAINIKFRKPRHFEKLTKSIIKYCAENNFGSKLFNLLIRDPQNRENNSFVKSNYFQDIFEQQKSNIQYLNAEDDFSTFFPLPFNKEQKEIYENYLSNRLTVVTGPPGTGKSHTIVNILCTLLAQGKRVLVTAQTDKALESLLEKIPPIFDDLIFTKIELETSKNRFSLEKSINNITNIISKKHLLAIDSKIKQLDQLKSVYLKKKSDIILALENEYSEININNAFNKLRPYQIIEKFESKESTEWDWIKDELNSNELDRFDTIRQQIMDYRQLIGTEIKYDNTVDSNIAEIDNSLDTLNFEQYLKALEQYKKQIHILNINEGETDDLKSIDFEVIFDICKKFSNNDIINFETKKIDNILAKINYQPSRKELNSNKSLNNLITNGAQYLLDIETYISNISSEKAGFITRYTNSGFKQVKYLEDFTINEKRCNTKTEILELRTLIEKLQAIDRVFQQLRQEGYEIYTNDNPSLLRQEGILTDIIEKVHLNREIVETIEGSQSFHIIAKYLDVNPFDINAILKKAPHLRSSVDKLKVIEASLAPQKEILSRIDKSITDFKLTREFGHLFPISKISELNDYMLAKAKMKEIIAQIVNQDHFLHLGRQLKEILPKSFDSLGAVPNEFIARENFEYASANSFFKVDKEIDIQKSKEELVSINRRIYQVKCEILYDLAKGNFSDQFDPHDIDSFINLLEEYKYNLSQSGRKIRNQSQFQALTRQNSIEISQRLSCWVMKFNDVLNSIGEKPEIFDCIIVDEASQLDFNSLILGYYAQNMIIVGDDKQTSPSGLTGADGNDFEAIKTKYLQFLGANTVHIKSDNSLFMLAKMTAGKSNLTLREHFRCVPEIIEFSKINFYDNLLRPLKQINSTRLQPKLHVFVDGAFSEDKVVYKEIEEIALYLRSLLGNIELQSKTVGVVSLGSSEHTKKLKDIKENLTGEFGRNKIDKHKLIIEDSPKFQGDERDIMIVSLGVAIDSEKTKNNQNAKPRAIITDMDEFKKINVALSRAKEQMILFHSVEAIHLQSNDFRIKIINFFKEDVKPILPLEIYENKLERSMYNVPAPFDSWFELDIAQALLREGFSYIQPQYNVKDPEPFFNYKLNKYVRVNFKLDLVVHKNGKMVAIECDGDPFHSLPEDVAYDVERQEFLERIGWKVYRILYSAFKRKPVEEIERMIEFINANTLKGTAPVIQRDTVDSIENVDRASRNLETIVTQQIVIDPLEVETEHASVLEVSLSDNNSHDLQIFPASDCESQDTEFELFRNYTSKIGENGDQNLTSISVNSHGIKYFNLFEDNSYKIQECVEPGSMCSIAISGTYTKGFLLQCYDNGHINKVNIKSLLEKRVGYHYSNGKNRNANIVLLTIIDEDVIIGIKIRTGSNVVFKAHKTENITNRDLLHLQGYKVVYQDFHSIEYKILPNSILPSIRRLTFSSFVAGGKSTSNMYYENEWRALKDFMPNLLE